MRLTSHAFNDRSSGSRRHFVSDSEPFFFELYVNFLPVFLPWYGVRCLDVFWELPLNRGNSEHMFWSIGRLFRKRRLIFVSFRNQPDLFLFAACRPDVACITPGMYSLLGAIGALGGATRTTGT